MSTIDLAFRSLSPLFFQRELLRFLSFSIVFEIWQVTLPTKRKQKGQKVLTAMTISLIPLPSSLDNALYQNRMKSCQPLFTPFNVIMIFGIIGILFILIGIVIIFSSAAVFLFLLYQF